jgi:deazaflavin-dependent oxidoreductase (nitroreductase family)
MDATIADALRRGQVIDITTTGRRSGQPRRIEIVSHHIDGRTYISGIPRADRRRSWIANLEADPRLTFHLKGPLVADVPGRARIVTDEAERRAVLPQVAAAWHRTDVEEMIRHSPLIEVTFDDEAA